MMMSSSGDGRSFGNRPNGSRLTQLHPDMVSGAVVNQRNGYRDTRQRLTVQFGVNHAVAHAIGILDQNHIARGTIFEGYFALWPMLRNARRQTQRCTLQTKSQYRLESDPVHPAGRTGVPSP